MKSRTKEFSCNDLSIMSFVFGAYTVLSLTVLAIEDEAIGWIVGLGLVYVFYLWFVWHSPDVKKIDRIMELMKESEA